MYSIIYADPPWHYNQRWSMKHNKTRFGGGACNHYPLMKTEEIMAMPIANITAPNAALLLWTTFPRLEDGLKVMKAWGFEYKTIGFIWVKTNRVDGKPFFGVGYYSKSNTEPCLLGIRGKMKPVSDSISSVVIHPRMEHSKKPPIIRDRIIELFGDLPRVELFARQEADGWDCHGNEVQNNSKFREGLWQTDRSVQSWSK